MPFSSASGKDHIRRIINRVPSAKMLDIGAGSGTYAKMFPHAEWTGVECWSPYVDQYGLESVYTHLHVEDAKSWQPTERYDVAIAGDVLHLMKPKEAIKLLSKLRSCAETVIVTIPTVETPSTDDGNPYMVANQNGMSQEAVHQLLGKPNWDGIDNDAGVYVWTPHRVGLKICVYAISKNEAHFVPRFCESAKEADLIVIADTGSTDGLPDVARQHGAVVHDICITPWRFDLARNAAMALIPRDMDVCISLDIDEVLQPGWRQEIERVWTPHTTRLRYMFDWGCGIQFYYEKIHARHGYMWHHPCHEYPVPDGRIKEVWATTPMLLAVHMPDPTKSRGQYLDLLELSVKEDPRCPRNAFYYARELSFHAKYEESIAAIERYLKMPEATWPNERCYAYRTMGRCYSELGRLEDAERAFQQAAAEAPNTREPWCELALLLYKQERWEETFAYSMRALRIKDKAAVYTCDPAVWGHWAHDLASIAAWNLGLKDIALEQAELAHKASPEEVRLKTNLDYIRAAMSNVASEAA